MERVIFNSAKKSERNEGSALYPVYICTVFACRFASWCVCAVYSVGACGRRRLVCGIGYTV